MSASADRKNGDLLRFKAYLETLTFIQIDPRLRGKFGWSDIIQKTLIEVWREMERIETMDEESQKRRLRCMLLNNLRDEIDHWRTKSRDVGREGSLDEAAERSSCRLNESIAAEGSTPSANAIKHEEEMQVLEALAQLPERQREVVILKQYHDWKLAEIADYLGCTTNVVAGLHARGLEKLRTLLPETE
jgi:RNA polymerase sigma-70 factor (ECF subfamily)